MIVCETCSRLEMQKPTFGLFLHLLDIILFLHSLLDSSSKRLKSLLIMLIHGVEGFSFLR